MRGPFLRQSLLVLNLLSSSHFIHGEDTSVPFKKLPFSALPASARILIPGNPDWLGIGFGSVWVTNRKGNEVYRIDPKTNQVVARISVGKAPCAGIGIGFGSVWIPIATAKAFRK